MISNDYHDYYRDFQFHRDYLMSAARHEILKQTATAPHTKRLRQVRVVTLASFIQSVGSVNSRTGSGGLKTMKRMFITLVVIVVMLAAAVSPMFAQDLVDTGSSEAYHPAMVQFRMGYYYQIHGDHERAVEEFNHVIEAFPNWENGYSARGDSYSALNQFDLAIADYTAALAIAPEFVSVRYMRARAYHALGEFRPAQNDYLDTIAQMADYPLPYLGLGDLYSDQGDTEAALEQYEQYTMLTGEIITL